MYMYEPNVNLSIEQLMLSGRLAKRKEEVGTPERSRSRRSANELRYHSVGSTLTENDRRAVESGNNYLSGKGEATLGQNF